MMVKMNDVVQFLLFTRKLLSSLGSSRQQAIIQHFITSSSFLLRIKAKIFERCRKIQFMKKNLLVSIHASSVTVSAISTDYLMRYFFSLREELLQLLIILISGPLLIWRANLFECSKEVMEELSNEDEKFEKDYRKCISSVLDQNFYQGLERCHPYNLKKG